MAFLGPLTESEEERQRRLGGPSVTPEPNPYMQQLESLTQPIDHVCPPSPRPQPKRRIYFQEGHRLQIIGIDPGLTMTGAVLLEDKVKTYAVFCPGKKSVQGVPIGVRVLSFSFYVADWVNEVVGDSPVRIVMELPVYNRNPLSFQKQCRLFQAIQDRLTAEGDREFVEVLPHAPKVVLGLKANASKDVVTGIFMLDYASEMADFNKAEISTLGDAWAIALCGKKKNLWREYF